MAKKRANGEGSIRKRKDGRWEGRYTAGHDPNTGKTIYKNVLGKTQGEVKEKLKKAIADSQQLDVTRATIRVHRNRRRSRSHQEHQARTALRRPDDSGENRFRGDPDRRQHCRKWHLPDGDPTFS